MATTFDKLITVYDVEDRYTSKVNAIARATDKFGESAQNIVRGISRGAIVAATTAIATAVAATVQFGVAAVQASASYEQLKVTLESLTGSADKAAQKMEFMRKLAVPSTFTFSELAQAGTQLEAFRVPLEKALPQIAKLGAAFPNKEISDFVSIWGRLAAGDFPDLEALSGAGLSKSDFKTEGIKFDSQGKLLSSAKETMEALDRIVNRKYGDILTKVGNTTNAKLATVRDKWETIMRKVGDALLKYVIPALDKLDALLTKVGKDKGFERWLKNIGANMLKIIGTLFGAVAALLGIAALVAAAFGDVIRAAGLAVAGILAYFAGVGIVKNGAKWLKGLQGGKAGAAGELPATPDGLEYPEGADDVMQEIARNTRSTAENTQKAIDFRRYALGGGNLGAMGVSPIEMGRMGGGAGGGSVSVNVSGAQGKATDFIKYISEMVLQDAIRQRAIR